MTDKILGIDLGTTNSALAIVDQGAPKLLSIQNERLLPSVVGIAPDGEVLVGTPARNQWVAAPERTVRSIKRQMGSTETVSMADRAYSPQEISAFILRRIKESAEAELGEPVERAVITVPAYFNEVQRQATIEAGEIAGLAVERSLNEPTAAALAYGFGLNDEEYRRILVYDLGGGTFDVSLIELNYGVVDVMATSGDNHLGGDDFDERLADILADEFDAEHRINLRADHRAWARLLRAAEEAKIALSSNPTATIEVDYIAENRRGNPLHIQREIERSEFVEIIEDLLQRTVTGIDRALDDAKLHAGEIDTVLLVGGSTRMPAVVDLVTERMDQSPHGEIDPDAAVALGAAVQAGIIAGEEIDAILVDVTPLSLGIETAHISVTGQLQTDHFVPLIQRNTTVPVQRSERFTTLFPGQEAIHVKVYQGENSIASQNVLLGDFMVEELQPNREDGLSEVNVNFQLDINGILNVTVTERGTGKQVTERLKASRQRLSPDEITASQAKLDVVHRVEGEIITDGMDAIDPGAAALLERAQAALADSAVSDELKAQITETADQLQEAVAAADEDEIETQSNALIDLLFEAEA